MQEKFERTEIDLIEKATWLAHFLLIHQLGSKSDFSSYSFSCVHICEGKIFIHESVTEI